MNYNRHRWCVVSSCKNNINKTPDKLFIKVPDDIEIRNVWLELAKRDPGSLSTKSRLYLCEDHFNLEQDMENYIEYKLMGSVKHIKMKVNTIPSRFCFETQKKCRSPSISESTLTNTQSQETENSKLSEDNIEPTATSSSDIPVLESEKNRADKVTQVETITTDKSILERLLSQKSKLVQENISALDISSAIDKQTSSGVTRFAKRKLIFEEKSSSEWPSPSECKTTSDSSLLEFNLEEQKLNYQNTLSKIKEISRMYLYPKEIYLLADILRKHTNTTRQQILLC